VPSCTEKRLWTLDKVIEKQFTMSFPTKEPTPANNFVGKKQQ
jgi:hypothetical protein